MFFGCKLTVLSNIEEYLNHRRILDNDLQDTSRSKVSRIMINQVNNNSMIKFSFLDSKNYEFLFSELHYNKCPLNLYRLIINKNTEFENKSNKAEYDFAFFLLFRKINMKSHSAPITSPPVFLSPGTAVRSYVFL